VHTTHEPQCARRIPIGAELNQDGTHFRVWAPDHNRVHVLLYDEQGSVSAEHPLRAESGGYFAGLVEGVRAGALYKYRLTGEDAFPDPASRFQPRGPEGPSQVVDPDAFVWTDSDWRGLKLEHQVLYELHVGTFTPAATWTGATGELERLADLGITAIEMMPVAEFGGRYGWGYDGVNLYAPTHRYGHPDDLKRLIDHAHRLGLGVILDVVYNHFGPSGNYITRFSSRYFSSRYHNEWGDPLNFDDDADAVREFMAANAAYWIREYHSDGLRLDATQQIFDASPRHIVRQIADEARAAAGRRSILVIAENEAQDSSLLRPETDGGGALDAMWNDDFHHAAVVALTGRREAYYTDYRGSAQEFISAAKHGFLFQGQRYSWQKKRRGGPTRGLTARRFITFLENHDQVANSPTGRGERLWQLSNPALYRAMTALWLLSPGTPMFFQGQESGSNWPFMYFADHEGELADAVRRGRAEFMSQFRGAATRDLYAELPIPDARTYERCRAVAGAATSSSLLALHRDLLALRRSDLVLKAAAEIPFDGAVLSPSVLALRWFLDADDATRLAMDRLLIVNLGIEQKVDPAPEPMLAPPEGQRWQTLWSSDDPLYGGPGSPPVDTDDGWNVPGHVAVVLAPVAV
jgi:maltooligosyltrehalose trehalohydrolase